MTAFEELSPECHILSTSALEELDQAEFPGLCPIVLIFAESGRKLCMLTSIPAFRKVHRKGRARAAYLHLTTL